MSPVELRGRAPLSASHSVESGWMIRFRWVVVGVGAALLFFARWFPGVEPDVVRDVWVGALLTLVAGTNVVLSRTGSFDSGSADTRSLDTWRIGAAFSIDVVVLTAILALTGGAANPFSVLFLAYVTCSAIRLGARWTAAMVLLTTACFTALFFLPTTAPAAGHHGMSMARDIGGAEGFDAHLYGMLVAFAVTASLIAYSVHLLSLQLSARERELRRADERAARSDRVAALTALAAGAAHELGSPLGTIAVAAHELEREASQGGSDRVRRDAALIGAEARRCRGILQRMSEQAGALSGEALVTRPAGALIEGALARLAAGRDRVGTELLVDVSSACLVPAMAFEQSLANLVQNGLDASADGRVEVRVSAHEGATVFEVRDRGRGMAAEELSRATEPFFSTKAAGRSQEARGRGLGLFLADSLAQRLGGRLKLASEVGVGTTATLELPR